VEWYQRQSHRFQVMADVILDSEDWREISRVPSEQRSSRLSKPPRRRSSNGRRSAGTDPLARPPREIYYDEGNAVGVRGDVAFAQSILETAWFAWPNSPDPNPPPTTTTAPTTTQSSDPVLDAYFGSSSRRLGTSRLVEGLSRPRLAGTLTQCDPFGIPSTSHWTGAAIIVHFRRTKTCIVTRPRTSPRPMPSSLAG
jgi:hypothetical protein